MTLCQLQIWDSRYKFEYLTAEHTSLFPSCALSLQVGIDHVASKCFVAAIWTGHLCILTHMFDMFLNASYFSFPIAPHLEVGTIQLQALNEPVHPYIIKYFEPVHSRLAACRTATVPCLPLRYTRFAERLSAAGRLGRITCQLHADGAEEMVLVRRLKDIVNTRVAASVPQWVASPLAQVGKTLQVFFMSVVLLDAR